MNALKLPPDGRRIWLLPLISLTWNQLVYCGGGWLSRNLPHYDMTLPVDWATPFLPWTVLIYLGCYLFWALNYVLCARQEKRQAYRFFAADLLSKTVCLLFFLLLPTTNLRPEVTGTGLCDQLIALVYEIDAPVNLFPSIHCLVSWLSWIGVRTQQDIPRWYRLFSLGMAVAVCLSTLTTKQHVVLDVAGGILLAELSYWIAGIWVGKHAASPAYPITK